MRTFTAHALMSKTNSRKRDTLNIAAADGSTDWQMVFFDPNPRDNIVDPGTNRTVTGVEWTVQDGATVSHGQNGSLGYDANYPFNSLAFSCPGVSIAQVGGPVDAGFGYNLLNFNVTLA